MAIPLKYNIRHVLLRWRTTSLTIFAVALVVAMFVCMLSLANGLETSLTDSGNPLNVVVMRKGATSETNSSVERSAFTVIQYAPEIARDAEDQPLAAKETINIVIMKRRTGGSTNAIVRGIDAQSLALRPEITLVEGRMPKPGLTELVVGTAASKRFENAQVGQKIKLVKTQYEIVGRFDAGQTAFNSEFWGDVEGLNREFDRTVYSSFLIRARDAASVEPLIKAIESNQQAPNLRGQKEVAYYKAQTISAAPIKFLGVFLSVVMSVGAVFAAMNTLYASIAGRSWEVATLRILGFSRTSILICFLIESVFLCLLGGVLGGLLSLPMNGVATGTTNFASFAEIAFAFQITPMLLLYGLLFSAFIGLVGGFLPALQASRQTIISSLRES
ncbi:MAG: ABC transporter permease [Candidatus Sumerlaeia bacterium]|nr:ABC transporter permease [Candidatus Sumerlaeia bacterium]